MKPLRVLIVTYNWPPRNAIGAHRPYTWAKYWSRQGTLVTVLTAQKYEYDAPLDLALPDLPGVEVLEVPYRSNFRFDRVLTLGVMRSWARRAKAALLKSRLGRPPDPRRSWRQAARAHLANLVGRCDVVVSTFGPEGSHLIASDLKALDPSIRWVADYRDLWSQNHATDMSNSERQRLEALELASVGSSADHLTTISDELASKLRLWAKTPVTVVANGFDCSDTELLCNLRPRPRAAGPLRIVHTGAVYPGLRDPEPLLKAIVDLHAEGSVAEGQLTVDLYGDRNDVANVLAARAEYKPFIRILGHRPRHEILEIQRQAFLLLLLESPLPGAMGVLTGKVFEYIASGVPVLSVGSQPGSAIDALLRSTGTGICVGTSAPDAADVLRPLLRGVRPVDWFRPNAAEIGRYSRERLAMEMLNGPLVDGRSR